MHHGEIEFAWEVVHEDTERLAWPCGGAVTGRGGFTELREVGCWIDGAHVD